ncbi:putative bifunctional diguanylate cyclase/phosphodiesterase [Azospirillum sp. A39]|uniref:putative bifunctional diguanylate cyclase/phosphodiesterase n=1 Tax=Azospirillum sp. A39 TaxID=3462279 RepID=UPI004046347E
MALIMAFAAVMLACLWGAVLHEINHERSTAIELGQRKAADLARAFEARLADRFNRLDHDLVEVRDAVGAPPGLRPGRLATLKRPLLDHALIQMAIIDAHGRLIDSTLPVSTGRSVADRSYFRAHREWAAAGTSDRLFVSEPMLGRFSDRWSVQFTRRIESADGAFAGILLFAVDPFVFVELAQDLPIGDHGFVSLVGRDRIIRLLQARHDATVQKTWLGRQIPADTALVDPERPGIAVVPMTVAGHATVTAYRRMPGIPLIAAVHLTVEELLAPVQERATFLVGAAAAGSAVVVLFAAGLAATIWRQHRTRAALAAANARLRDSEQALEQRVLERTRELEESNLHVQELAYTDPLTHLPNRARFAQRAAEAVDRAAREGRMMALLFLDLDRFKMVNDTLGHAAGDELLVEVATRIRRIVRRSDVVARMGGDEFVIIAENLAAPGDAHHTAQRLLAAFAAPVSVRGQDLHLGLSIGIALFPDDGADASTLLKSADAAMYAAKAAGRHTVRQFSAAMSDAAARRLELETALRRAVQEQALTLVYQPKLCLATGRVRGVEALVRWQHPECGSVSPAEFIPLAEETGLIEPIGAWVLEEACRTIAGWDDERLGPLSVAVNVAATQVTRGDLVGQIERLTHAHRVDPTRLEIEVTETAVLADTDRAFATLNRLRSLGVVVALDDFGTGYSSLAHLRQLDIDSIKIDRSFLDGVRLGNRNAEIVRLIIRLAKALDLTVVAEGVECPEHVTFLKESGCDLIQGFHIARPMPLAELEAWVAGRRGAGVCGRRSGAAAA